MDFLYFDYLVETDKFRKDIKKLSWCLVLDSLRIKNLLWLSERWEKLFLIVEEED